MEQRFALAVRRLGILCSLSIAVGCGGETHATNAPIDAGLDANGVDGGTCTDGAIRASNYDLTCKSNSDCVSIAEGNACALCGLNCPGSAISARAYPKYLADIANTPAGISDRGPNCLSGCPAEFAPCCRGGTCHADFLCSNPGAAGDDGGGD